MRAFFGIESDRWIPEFMDLSTLLTIANVVLIIAGWRFAPTIGVINCVASIGIGTRTSAHINYYIMQIALIILNLFFLFS